MSSSQASSLFKDNSILSSEIDLDLATVPILKQNFEKCVKCLKSVNPVTETSVNFSSGLYHTDCFCCSKCSQIIDCENQVIVLSDENEALCADCSLKCKSCKRPILEDAVTTGESTYHPACFNCDTCGEKISSLTFAFVEDKLMCTSCHNEINQLSSSINSESSIQVIKKLASQNKILSKSLEKLENINITLEASQIEVESELSLIKKDLAKETARRVQAELMVNKLQTELARYQPGDSNDCLNQNTEEVAMKTTFIKLEIDDLNEQKTSLQNQLEEIKKEMLNQDIKAVYASNDDLENIKDTFHLEIAQLKADKSALKVDITRLVEKKIELMKELDRLRDKKPEAKKPAKVIVLTPGKSSAENLATPPAADTSPLSVSSNSVTLNLENANLDKQPKVEKEKKVGGWTQMLATATTSSPKTKSKDVAKSVITKSGNII